MPAGHVRQRSLGRVQDGDHERRRPGTRQGAGEALEAADRGCRVGGALQRVDQHGPQLAHHRRGGHPVPDDVADDQTDLPAVQWPDVEPVPTRGLLLTGHQVARGHVDAGQHRHTVRQQRLLQFADEVVGPAVPGAALGRLLLCTAAGRHLLGDVLGHADDPPDGPVGSAPRHGGPAHDQLGHAAVERIGQLEAPLRGVERLPRSEDLGVDVQDALRGQLRVDLGQREAHPLLPLGEGLDRRADGHGPQFRTVHRHHEDRHGVQHRTQRGQFRGRPRSRLTDRLVLHLASLRASGRTRRQPAAPPFPSWPLADGAAEARHAAILAVSAAGRSGVCAAVDRFGTRCRHSTAPCPRRWG